MSDDARGQLLQRLAGSAPSFDFFQAVRMLLRGTAPLDARRRTTRTAQVRFRSNLSFQFKASDVQAITLPAAEGEPATLTVNFLGIASPGITGSLPNWYATAALAEASDREAPNRAMVEFFALFDDRLVQLYFRAWLRNNLPLQYELSKDGLVARMLRSCVGFGTPGLAAMLPFDPRALVHHAALLARRPATAAALADSLAIWFGVPFEVVQFVEMRAALEPEQRLRLGDHTMQLGETTALGDCVRMRQGKFLLRAGPLRWEQMVGFLPGDAAADDGAALRDLTAWVRQAVGAEFDYDLQLVLREDEVPVFAFRSDEPQRARLGMSTWLGARLPDADATDTFVAASALEQRRRAERRTSSVSP